jgi:DNA-binding transcriptional MerR regulator
MASIEFTVEQLAAHVDLPTSTVRMYQTKGLLHAPDRIGRTARYDDTHLQRLVLIQRLQHRGFSLSAIAELISARAAGATVAEVLGLAGDGSEDWVPVGIRELRTIIAARELRPRLLRRATQLGLLTWRRRRPHARRWVLDSGLRLCALAVPPDEILEEYTALRTTTDQIAARFVTIFERRLWPTVAVQSERPDQLAQVRQLLEELTTTAETVVVGALRDSVRNAAEQFARRHQLVPANGPQPSWLRTPVPRLTDRLNNSDTDEEADVDGYLAEADTEQ